MESKPCKPLLCWESGIRMVSSSGMQQYNVIKLLSKLSARHCAKVPASSLGEAKSRDTSLKLNIY